MAVVPTMMALYTNDAVDVHYSDGSRLQFSPCGSSMFHHDPPSGNPRHPLAGVQGVQKWTQFVTSSHRDKVIQALDFRNRFACRPLLCSTLTPPGDIVSLYAKIDAIAWGRSMEECRVEVFEDGTRRVVSNDEYASLVLSPHGQDFTVCYLSHISPDMKGDESIQQQQLSQQDGKCVSEDADSMNLCADLPGIDGDRGEYTTKSTGADRNEDLLLNYRNTNNNCVDTTNRNCNNSTPVADILEEVTMDTSGLILSDGTVSTPGRTQSELQTSVISAHHDISSISRVSSPDGLRGMVDCDDTLAFSDDTLVKPPSQAKDILHSSPMSMGATQSCISKENNNEDMTGQIGSTEGHKTDCGRSSLPVPSGSAEQKSAIKQAISSQDHSNHLNMTEDVKKCLPRKPILGQSTAENGEHTPAVNNSHSAEQLLPGNGWGQENADHSQLLRQDLRTVFSQQAVGQEKGKRAKRHGGVSGLRKAETWSATRQHYTWVTQHISCNSCPTAWRHPLRILQKVDQTDSLLISECNLTISSNIARGTHRGSAVGAEKCVLSSVPPPVSLSCPFQHLHTWLPHHGEEVKQEPDSLSEFSHGQLKVLMMEGIVYRFVDIAGIMVVEIYPGDGSVFISQGTTAHFFLHISWTDGKLEEKTYSVNMLPPRQATSGYSVQNLIKRGHRLLTGCIHNSKLHNRKEVPCWKLEPVQLVEPLSSSLLEECTVPGYGRFTAYSNGRIRVVFDDRTTLDMVSDFSQRLQGCMKHSDVSEVSENHIGEKLAAMKVTCFDGNLSQHHCRLMLASGKFLTVDVQKPGVYQKYVAAAKEWINWVQSSPKERLHFYHSKAIHRTAHLSAEAELKKIECFNYIVAHSGISNSSSASHNTAVTKAYSQPSTADFLPITSDVCFASQHSPRPPQSVDSCSSRPTQQWGNSRNSLHINNNRSFPVVSNPKDAEMLQGFNSVREALLRTSKMIKDIDEIVKDHKSAV